MVSEICPERRLTGMKMEKVLFWQVQDTEILCQFFRIYDEVSWDIKARRKRKKPENNKLVGASVFPVELFKPDDRPLTSLHPWACSLRTKGFRGRHRCGVTLLSGEKCTAIIFGYI